MSIDIDALDARLDAAGDRLSRYRAAGLRVFATSSFQPNSVLLLHLLATRAPWVPVYFLDTGYHFPETLLWRDALAARTGLRVVDLRSPMPRSQQRDADGRLLFVSDPDRCCHLNKVLPLQPVQAAHDVWVTGLRAAQSAQRADMDEEEPDASGVLKYSPLLRWTGRELEAMRDARALPRHPLEGRGFASIGCSPCTTASGGGLDDRAGRWSGQRKTECGLHGGAR